MKLDGTAEYMPDGDIILVTIYVLEGTKARPNTIVHGRCTHYLGQVEYGHANFDRTNGNTDGPVKIAFNHPPVTTGSMRVTVTTDTDALDAIFPIQILPTTPVNVAGNEF